MNIASMRVKPVALVFEANLIDDNHNHEWMNELYMTISVI